MKQQRHTAIREVTQPGPGAEPGRAAAQACAARISCDAGDASRGTFTSCGLSKGPAGYALPGNGADEDEDSLPGIREVLGSFGIEVRQAMNQLVLITTTSAAQPVAAGIDYEDWPEVVGTIAGDDTVLIVCPDERQARTLKVRIEGYIG